ncbi:MAG: hypothetical protein GFH23_1086734n1, partial [Chloroflexi bacterium AL-N1]|nr:hypothetical protein [Chloroflexi bacterium AL-N1]
RTAAHRPDRSFSHADMYWRRRSSLDRRTMGVVGDALG